MQKLAAKYIKHAKYAKHTREACSPAAHPLQRQSWEQIWEGSSVDDTNCTMNHEIVPKSIDWLQPAQNVSVHHKEIINMQNMQNMYLGSPEGASKFRAFRHHQSRAWLRRRVADGKLCSVA
jgi:hypothetical protein